MNFENLENQIEQLKNQVKALESKLKSQKENEMKPKNVWDLNVEDEQDCFWIDSAGLPYHTKFNCISDERARIAGNVFLTENEAIREGKRRKVEALLLRYGGRREFKPGEDNYNLYYNYINSKLKFVTSRYTRDNNVFFNSRKAIQDAINKIGEEKIIRDYFMVTEND